jgi:flagellar basal body rod protein FlgG
MISVTQTGLNAVQKELNVLSNNLANASTVGFKRSYTNFGDIFSNDPASNPKTSIGMGITTQSVSRDTTQGALKSTSNVTDLAIDGQGYFVLGTNLPTEPLVPQMPIVIPPFNGLGLNVSSKKLPPPLPPSIPVENGQSLKQISNNPVTYEPSVKLRLFNIKNNGAYEGVDDGFDIFIDGKKEFTHRTTNPSDPSYGNLYNEIDISKLIKSTGSDIKIDFYNGFSNWDWGYSLTVNGKNTAAERSLYQTYQSDSNANGQQTLTKSVSLTVPDLSASDNRPAWDWKSAFSLASTSNVILKTVGLAGGVDGELNDGNNYIIDNSKDGFTGRNPYIAFGDPNGVSYSDTQNRSVQFQPLDLTAVGQLTFDAIRGNNLNGGSSPNASGDEFGVFYSIDGGNTFKEINTQNSSELTTLSNSNAVFNNWYGVTINIPDEARTKNTIIKLKQEISSTPQYNLWGISNLDLIPNEPISSNSESSSFDSWNNGTSSGKSKNVYGKSFGTGLKEDDGFTGKSNYISFGGDGSEGARVFMYDSLDLRSKNSISFDIIKGNGLNGGETPNVGEGLSLEYSLDGVTFFPITHYSVSDTSLDNWSNKSINLPNAARTASTIIRFRQAMSSGAKYDHWGLTNITFENADISEPLSSDSTTGIIRNWTFSTLNGSSRNVFQTNKGSGSAANDGFNVKDNYIIFGTDGDAGERNLTYNPVDLSLKDSITFDLIRGNGSNGGDFPNNSPEGLSVLYSTDNGVTYKNLKTFDYSDTTLDIWSNQSITLPADARTKSTMIKFQQLQSSGAPYDHWGLSNIAFTDTPPKPEVVPQLVYSRAGNFGVDKDGYVVNPSGFKLMGTDIKTGKTNKAVRIPSADPITNQPLQAVSINNKGVVSATYGAGPSVDLYRISIATFASDAGLKPLGNVAFAQTGASGTAKISNAGEGGGGNVMAGTLEQANVDITNELMAMIAAQQIYNGNARMLQSQIEALKRLTDNI